MRNIIIIKVQNVEICDEVEKSKIFILFSLQIDTFLPVNFIYADTFLTANYI